MIPAGMKEAQRYTRHISSEVIYVNYLSLHA